MLPKKILLYKGIIIWVESDATSWGKNTYKVPRHVSIGEPLSNKDGSKV
jgi:hypothetical protein